MSPFAVATEWPKITGSAGALSKVLIFGIDQKALNSLKIIELTADSPEYVALSRAWQCQDPIPVPTLNYSFAVQIHRI
jgi:hypothetical protein